MTIANADLLYAEACLLSAQFKADAAADKLRLCVQIRRHLLGRQIATARALHMLARQYHALWKQNPVSKEECYQLLIEARAIFEEQIDFDKSELAVIICQLSEHIFDRKNIDSVRRSKELRELAFALVNEKHELNSMAAVTNCDIQQRAFELSEAVELLKLVHGDDSLEVARALVVIGNQDHSFAAGQTEGERMIGCYSRAIEILVSKLGPDHPEIADVRLSLGFAHCVLNKLGDAERQYEDALRIYISVHGVDSLEALKVRRMLLSIFLPSSPQHVKLSREIVEHCPVEEEIKAAAL